MERPVKERLIGAAVLVAAAVILIPEMLSGPKRPATPEAPARAGEAPIKTYTIDLNRSPDAPATPAAVVEERAPPPEIAASEPATGSPAAEPPAQPQAIPESAPVKSAPAPEPARVAVSKPPEQGPAKPPEKPAARPEPRPLAPAATAPISRQWAVQLGSFSSKATAEKLAKDWDAKGLRAFVMPVKSGTNTLYRVRLGPFADHGAAADALRKVAGQASGAAVVGHP